jgi:MYXO-CTERM domain-containing protein
MAEEPVVVEGCALAEPPRRVPTWLLAALALAALSLLRRRATCG